MVWPGTGGVSGRASLPPLVADQAEAVDPESLVWLSASAGTGKTQVLTSRVFRLLLQPGVRPEHILCLTFTKAGASEMAERIHRQLSQWVRANDRDLLSDLKAIGAPVDPETRTQARRLFARVVDAPQGGLRIQTIHSFCQTLLAGFPMEAGLVPGFRAIEERDQKLLAKRVLADMLEEARRQGDEALFDNLAQLSIRLGEEEAERYLLRCAGAIDLWDQWRGDVLPHVHRLFGLPLGMDHAALAQMCGDDVFPSAALRAIAAINRQWGAKTGIDFAVAADTWLSLDVEDRFAQLEIALEVVATKGGELRACASQTKLDPAYPDHAATVFAALLDIAQQRSLVDFAAFSARALSAGRAFAFAYDAAKRREGLMDFDDQIRVAARLIGEPGMGEWIRYKLDQQFDHILVDESQDTNVRQWEIVDGLISDFFAGKGARTDRLRTLFTVGDFKQAIFGFQGTSPQNYAAARCHFGEKAAASKRPLSELSLVQSFRSAQPVLDFVDATLDTLGQEQLGLDRPSPPHEGRDIPGQVLLWPPVRAEVAGEGEDEEGWLAAPQRVLADRIAEQVKQWLDRGVWLAKAGRRAGPGDIMILLRKRGDLAALIVARLHALGIPVAGIDRLRLGQPLAVQDLLAAMRFALQPHDDLNLAALLVSPLIGWSQDDLLKHGYRREDRRTMPSLWRHLRRQEPLAGALVSLRDILAMADFGTPHEFLEALLSGPLQGRAKLVARLGTEALDPIGELVNIARQFPREHVPSLQNFVHWFDSDDEEIKREIQEGADEMRVLTVHGAKGLQAPIVILADACVDPGLARDRHFGWPLEGGVEVPLVTPRKSETAGALAAVRGQIARQDTEEHWRLLYVAMTRAEERLCAVGALGSRAGDQPPENSWYAAMARAMAELDHDQLEDPLWGGVLSFGSEAIPPAAMPPVDQAKTRAKPSFPPWLLTPPRAEERPARPLTPSQIGADDAPYPPRAGGEGSIAALRGRLLHGLFERLPAVVYEVRAERGLAWLERQSGLDLLENPASLVGRVLRIIENPEFAPIFAPEGLSEVPIAAVVDGVTVSGVADRVLIGPESIAVIDYKTGSYVPASSAEVPAQYLKQMAAYRAALRTIYPGRPVMAALLFTEAPRLIELPGDLLDAHWPPA